MNYINFIYNHPGVFYYLAAIIIIIVISIWRKWYILDKKNLFRQKLFWLSVGIPTISFIYFGIFAWWGKAPVLSAHGYARFYEISKFPLLLLASSVPLASIVNNIHRTIQTEAQIETSETKNAIDRHLAHEKNFIEKAKEVLSYDIRNAVNHKGELKTFIFPDDGIHPEDAATNLLKTANLKVTNPYSLYSEIYKESTIFPTSSYNPCQDFILKIDKSFKEIDDALDSNNTLHKLPPQEYLETLKCVSYNTALILDALNVECISNLQVEIKKENNSIYIFSNNEMIFVDILEATYYISKKFISLVYGIHLKKYDNIDNYLYNGNQRFYFEDFVANVIDFYSPEWESYTSDTYATEYDGDKLAAEH